MFVSDKRCLLGLRMDRLHCRGIYDAIFAGEKSRSVSTQSLSTTKVKRLHLFGFDDDIHTLIQGGE